jgi:hypothetical protein
LDKHPFEYQKEALVEIFAHARAYTNVVMVTGYAGIFALWSLQAERITPATSLGVGLLMAISVTTFVGWEIFGMVQRYISLSSLRKSLDNPARAASEMEQLSARSQRLMRALERVWHPVIFIAAGTAAIAMLMLVSAFTHGLWIKHSAIALSKDSAMEFNFLSLFLGGLIAGLTGFACFRIEGWRNVKNGRRGLAQALEADLRSSAELYGEISTLWASDNTILFDYLDQLIFVRSNYNIDRPHFGLLSDEDMRIRLNHYFRTSHVTLGKLREKQEGIYRTTDANRQIELRNEIDSAIDLLRDHQREANEIADQLSIRFK